MRVILIQPTIGVRATIGPPLGLAYLAANLEREGHDVKIVDAGILRYKLKDIKRELTRFDPDVVGITSTTMYIYNALSIAKFAKEYNPSIITILGGPHPTVRSREILENNEFVDVVVEGEGEITLTELLRRKNLSEWKYVNGITFRLNGKIIKNKPRDLIWDLDRIPFPAYHLLPMDKYRVKFIDGNIFGKISNRYVGINTSRGCPYNCIFCSSRRLWGTKWRARSPENVMEEIRLLKDKYRVNIVDFLDDSFSINEKRAEKICRLIMDEKLDVSLICSTRVDHFNKNLSTILKKSGCNIVFFGFESGVQRTLDYLRKGFTVDDIKIAVKNAKQAGLKVGGSFIIGNPIETKDMIYKTINFAKKLRLTTASFNFLTPLPGTEIYEIVKKNGLLLTTDWSKYDGSNPIIRIDCCTPQELIKIRRQINLYYVTVNRFLSKFMTQ